MCIPYLKFSDPLPETHLFFYLALLVCFMHKDTDCIHVVSLVVSLAKFLNNDIFFSVLMYLCPLVLSANNLFKHFGP